MQLRSDTRITKLDALAVPAITAAGGVLYYFLGIHFDVSTLAPYMQFIDQQLLTNQLLESLWYYHANPPLLNLFTGIVLKVFGEASILVFSLAFHALGFLLALAVFALASALSESRRIAYILTALFVFSPAFVLYENWLMYTFPAAALLGLSAYALSRYVETESGRWGLAFFSCLAVIALTRSMFHLVWALVVTGGLILVLRHQLKRTLLCAVIPLLLVTGWYAKNYYLFGTFSASTWMGLGLTNITTLMVPREALAPLVRDGTLSKYALVSRYEDARQLFPDVETPFDDIPVLHDKRKSTGKLNFNYVGLIDINNHYARDALQTVRHFPSNYLSGVKLANRLFFSPASMNCYFTLENRVAAAPMEMLYNPLFYGASILPKTTEEPHYGYSGKYVLEVNTGVILIIGVPLLFLYGLIRLLRAFAGKSPYRSAEAVVLAYLLFNIAYIYSLGTLLELGENWRYRFLQEPFVLVLLSLLIRDLSRVRRGRQPTDSALRRAGADAGAQ
jgi:hypothetical protein